MGQGEEATRFSPRRQIGKHMAVDSSLPRRSSFPPSLIASCESASPPSHMRQTDASFIFNLLQNWQR